jgi:hypothetical protein
MVGAAAPMAKAFGALVKVIYDFVVSDLSPAARTMDISYTSLLSLEIVLCFIISLIDVDIEQNPRRFRFLSFFLGFVEMCVLTVKGAMDIMDASGLFYDIDERKNVTSIVG